MMMRVVLYRVNVLIKSERLVVVVVVQSQFLRLHLLRSLLGGHNSNSLGRILKTSMMSLKNVSR